MKKPELFLNLDGELIPLTRAEFKLKRTEPEYKGVKFKSELEARWAVYFDRCGIEWEYKPQKFDLGDDIKYSPDFLLHNIVGRPFSDKDWNDVPSDLWVEVKEDMDYKDFKIIERWVGDISWGAAPYYTIIGEHPTLILGRLPFFYVDSKQGISDWIDDYRYNVSFGKLFYSYTVIDGGFCQCLIGVNKDGKPTLMEPEAHQDQNNEDWTQTGNNLFYARNYRFDYRKKR